MIYFTAHIFNCVCHCIRAMFRVLGMYNFDFSKKSLSSFATYYKRPWDRSKIYIQYYFFFSLAQALVNPIYQVVGYLRWPKALQMYKNTYLGTIPRVTLRRAMIRHLVSGRYIRYRWQGGIARVHHTTSATSGVGSSHLLLLLLRRRLLEIRIRYYIWFSKLFWSQMSLL